MKLLYMLLDSPNYGKFSPEKHHNVSNVADFSGAILLKAPQEVISSAVEMFVNDLNGKYGFYFRTQISK